jgi:myxalamid-type polyketide synthase MxaB
MFDKIQDILSQRASKQPEQTAYILLSDGETESARVTYKDLEEGAKAIAAQLQSQMAVGDRALLLYQSGPEFITAFFGCLYAGVIAVPAYPPRKNQKLGRLQAIIKDAQAKVALTTTSLSKDIQTCTDSELSKIPDLVTDHIPEAKALNWQKPNISSIDIALLQYTSGSMGKPKGVEITHQNLIHNQKLIAENFAHTPETVGVSWLPFYHSLGLSSILQSIYVGFPCVIMRPEAFIQKPWRWLQAISNYHATSSGGTNFAYELCVSKNKHQDSLNLDLSYWKIAFIGGEPVQAHTLEKFTSAFAKYGFQKQAFCPCYGMTESTLFISGGTKNHSPIIQAVAKDALLENRVISVNSQHYNAQLLVSCGNSQFGQKIIIVNPDTLIPCCEKEVGEVWVSSDSIAQGYWQRHQQTEATFNAYIATDESPFLRTGDLGFVYKDELFIIGRIKNFMTIQGRNYYPDDLEYTVQLCHPALKQTKGVVFTLEIEQQENLVIVQEIEQSYLHKLNSQEIINQIIYSIEQEYQLDVYAVALLKPETIFPRANRPIQRMACRVNFLSGNLDVLADWSKQPEHKNSFQKLKSELDFLLKQVEGNLSIKETVCHN